MIMTVTATPDGVNVVVDNETDPMNLLDSVTAAGILLGHLLLQVADSTERIGLSGHAIQVAAHHVGNEQAAAAGITQ